ncbi:cytochrome P450 [Streptomyces harbinensis]|uniref:cytochrome P450 n=1 Tax=Streptomyces harbinensis TaxID=1176198 RepID=UPI0037128CED
MSPAPPAAGGLHRAGPADRARFLLRVLLPGAAEGLIRRRPWAMSLAERLRTDRAAITTLRDLRHRYGPRPLRLRVAGRSLVLLLDPDDLARLLRETPDPFTPASWEKRRALEQFQPHGSLITPGPERAARRRANEEALDSGRPEHRLAPALTARIHQEAAAVAERARAGGQLDWDLFAAGWWRSVRRLVLGEAAAGDTALIGLLDRLRSTGNWSMLAPRRERLRAAFLDRLRTAIDRADPDSLAGALRAGPAAREHGVDPVHQVPHWLFAFDAAGAATLRTLALLTCHPDREAEVRAETAAPWPGTGREPVAPLPRTRAAVLEAVRLWPTTPVLLRESTRATRWYGTVVPAGTAFAAFTPYFHRAEPPTGYRDRFDPDIWRDGTAAGNPALVPFSAGPAGCPGEQVVLLTAGHWLAGLLAGTRYRTVSALRPGPDRPLPATFDHTGLRFTARRA